MTNSIAEVIKAFDAKTTPMAKDITKRELFAAMAMQGIFASDVSNENTTEQVVEWSIHAADTLLAELAKEKKE